MFTNYVMYGNLSIDVIFIRAIVVFCKIKNWIQNLEEIFQK